MMQPADLRQVTVLSRAEWQRIQDQSNQVNRHGQSIREAAQQRKALHLKSQEEVKCWPNTKAGQRQKMLEAKKIREQKEEEQKKLLDIEEAKYQAEKRKEAITKATAQQFYHTDRVKAFHGALLMTEVLKEREAQIELKKRIQSASKDLDKQFITMMMSREDEALQQEQQKALQKQLERQDLAEDLKKQMRETEQARERDKLKKKKEGEEILHLQEMYLAEQTMEKEKKGEQRRNNMQVWKDHISTKDIMRKLDAQKQEVEEERRQLYLTAKQKMMKLRKEKETELHREAQMQRDRLMDKLTATLKDQVIDEEDGDKDGTARAAAEREAKEAQQQRDKEEERAAMLRSIAAHRESMRQEKEQREKMAHENAQAMLQAKREADRIFLEKQQLKAQKMREDAILLQDFNANQMAERNARRQQLKKMEQEFEAKNEELIEQEEKQFQQYTKHVINAAADAQRNVCPLRKAAREGLGGGSGPIFGGVRPRYLVQDHTGAEMARYVTARSQDIKEHLEAVDIEYSKKRLGFVWE
ncbi:coiled-coil domain-containing protein 173 [Myripristis murdjan]|uniref:coiled-coil domain-containing protein 173 n=1 Tax=Myripristis murdjan TaxID=586833 RepID=UPI001175E971|nr:coiled-coil domain-containing protein 173 [Myripristis murdjan]